jgi:hypothetical protein
MENPKLKIENRGTGVQPVHSGSDNIFESRRRNFRAAKLAGGMTVLFWFIF